MAVVGRGSEEADSVLESRLSAKGILREGRTECEVVQRQAVKLILLSGSTTNSF